MALSRAHSVLCYAFRSIEDVVPAGERVAERRDQAHQLLEPDLVRTSVGKRDKHQAQNPAGLAMVYVLLPSGCGHDGSPKEVYMAASEGSLKRTSLDWQWRTRDF